MTSPNTPVDVEAVKASSSSGAERESSASPAHPTGESFGEKLKLAELAEAIHRGRFPSDREPTPFGEAGVSETAYCYRIAKSVFRLVYAAPENTGPAGLLREGRDLLTSLAQIIDVVKQEWIEANSWSAWDQEQRDGITRWLTAFYALSSEVQPVGAAGEAEAALSATDEPTLSRLLAERRDLRTALIASGRNAGALLADEVSSEFLTKVPEEVAGVIAALRSRAERAEAERREMLEALKLARVTVAAQVETERYLARKAERAGEYTPDPADAHKSAAVKALDAIDAALSALPEGKGE